MQGGMSSNGLELDCLWTVIEAALRIRRRHQLFVWAQGVLQSVMRHELLVCALVGGTPGEDDCEVVAAVDFPAARLAAVRGAGCGLAGRLAALWRAGDFRPMLISRRATINGRTSAILETLEQLGLDNLAAHGILDRNGAAAAFFCFAQLPEPIEDRQASAVELLVPYLYDAFMRVRLDRDPKRDPRVLPPAVLSEREVEILRCLQSGRTNIEIGQVLGISPLTVKNHVQRILRKLRAQNRTEAVAKGLRLDILQMPGARERDPSSDAPAPWRGSTRNRGGRAA